MSETTLVLIGGLVGWGFVFFLGLAVFGFLVTWAFWAVESNKMLTWLKISNWISLVALVFLVIYGVIEWLLLRNF